MPLLYIDRYIYIYIAILIAPGVMNTMLASPYIIDQAHFHQKLQVLHFFYAIIWRMLHFTKISLKLWGYSFKKCALLSMLVIHYLSLQPCLPDTNHSNFSNMQFLNRNKVWSSLLIFSCQQIEKSLKKLKSQVVCVVQVREDDLKAVQEKLRQSELRLTEQRNQCQSLRQELKMAQKVRLAKLMVQS